MIYIKKNAEQQIVDISFEYKEGFEKTSVFNNEIKDFIKNVKNENLIKGIMYNLDLDMVRVTEDIIDILIKKEIILFTDFPEAVQSKLVFKRFLREVINNPNSNDDFMQDDDGIRF